MRNRSRLDLICVPHGVDTVFDDSCWDRVRREWEVAGLLAEGGAPTPLLVEGGGTGTRLDQPSSRVVYGNQLGGLRVHCPHCGAGMARAFARAVEDARDGGPIRIPCPSCGAEHPLDGIVTRPPSRVGRSALLLEDVQGSRLTLEGERAVNAWIGPFDLVMRRVS